MKDKPIKSIEEYKFHCNACYGNPSSTEGCFTDDVTTTTTSCKEDGLWGKEIQPIWNSNPLRLRPTDAPVFGKVTEQLNKENKMENKIIKRSSLYGTAIH